MGMDVSNFYAINTYEDKNGKKGYYFHEFKNNDGKAGELVTMGDGFGDAKEAATQFIKDGFDPNKIKINGQLASDVFKKENDTQKPENNNENVSGIKKFFKNIKNFFTNKLFANAGAAGVSASADNSLLLANQIALQQHQMANDTLNLVNQQNALINQQNDINNMMQMSAMGII